jgi:hypothetical protein
VVWEEQLQDFHDEIDEVDFDPGYIAERHERYRLNEFDLPEGVLGEDSTTIRNLEPIDVNGDYAGRITAVVGFCRDENGAEVILFQNFTKSHVIGPGKFIFLKNGTFTTTENLGLTLNNHLDAVYFLAERKLLFKNFRFTNTFLPLIGYYQDATEQEIKEILAHPSLFAENSVALAKGANQWFSKRFAMLRDSGILDNYTVQQIVDHSQGYDVDIHVVDGEDVEQIVFPEDKAEAKRLLQFLNEELFRGAITERLFETNSKREA